MFVFLCVRVHARVCVLDDEQAQMYWKNPPILRYIVYDFIIHLFSQEGQ
jgi:hypothetical protein